GGSIVNVSSLAAIYGMPMALHYTVSKAAVIGMTRGLARELGPSGVRVNAVAPSAVATEGTKLFFGEKFQKAFEAIEKGQSLSGNVTMRDVNDSIVWLLSDRSRFVTGQTIMVDGGTIMN
ncbi:SDR family oxidoreductase, partial [Arthrospira platensis SPKY1]|nr:SDR family oxidoreductase [Arthrospira platensis SPKY1]